MKIQFDPETERNIRKVRREFNSKAKMIEVRTSEYQFSHGHLPRGRGGWLFTIGRQTGQRADYFSANGTYADARTAAIELAVADGQTTITVQP